MQVFVNAMSGRCRGMLGVMAGMLSAILFASVDACAQSSSNNCNARWAPGLAIAQYNNNFIRTGVRLADGRVFVSGGIASLGTTAVQDSALFDPFTGKVVDLGAARTDTGLLVRGGSVAAALSNGRVVLAATLGEPPAPLFVGVVLCDPTFNRWTLMPGIRGGNVTALVPLPGGDIMAFGSGLQTDQSLGQTSPVARWSAATGAWSLVRTSVTGSVTCAVATLSGRIYIGGAFRAAGSSRSEILAYFDPPTSTLVPLTLGAGNYLTALAALPTGELVLAGSMTSTIDGQPVAVGKFSPATGEFTRLIRDGNATQVVVTPQGDIIVAGNSLSLSSAIPMTTNYSIARLRSQTSDWESLAQIGARTVNTLTYCGANQCLVGGSFTAYQPPFTFNGLAQLSLCTCSIADISSVGGAPGGEGQLTSDDLIAFLSAFAGRRPMADIASRGGILTPDGQYTADDVIAFLSAYFQGCP